MSAERVSVYIDGSNLFHCGNAEGYRIDYTRKFLPFLLQGRTLINSYFYNGRMKGKGGRSFIRRLISAGYIVKEFNVKHIPPNPPEEKRIDTQLVADSIVDGFSKKYDTAIICSGDEDIVPCIEYILSFGKNVEVFAFSKGLSWEVRETKHLGAKIHPLTHHISAIKR